jgi:hypothetical protein
MATTATVDMNVNVPLDPPRPLGAAGGDLPGEDDCLAYLVAIRWPDGVRCPRCGSGRVCKVARPWKWQCRNCARNGYRFSPLVGTVFENTRCALNHWLRVVDHVITTHQHVTVRRVQELAGECSYATASRIRTCLRAAFEPLPRPLSFADAVRAVLATPPPPPRRRRAAAEAASSAI